MSQVLGVLPAQRNALMGGAVALVIMACMVGCTEVRGSSDHRDQATFGWRSYVAPWFSIQFPDSFQVSPSLRSKSDEGFDSVFFDAPDGCARFYVLSPQWGRNASDVLPDDSIEIETARTETTVGERRVVSRIISARDGSYTRIVEENFEQDGVVYWATGFQYRTVEDRERLSEAYSHFKSSLEQYAD